MLRLSFYALIAGLCISPIAETAFWPKRFFSKNTFERFADAQYFAVILVDARHFQKSRLGDFLNSSHRLRDEHNLFGHVWVLLVDRHNGRRWECGYSGEIDPALPSYTKGLGMMIEGQASEKMLKHGADLLNPVSYLFAKRNDGYLQWGSGGHTPNCAVGFALTRSQFDRSVHFIENWKKNTYCLQRANCVHFALEFARFAGQDLSHCRQNVHIPKIIWINSHRVVLRRNARYSTLRIATPDTLEGVIKRQFSKESIEYALKWYMDYGI